MLFADLLSLHLVTFLMFLFLLLLYMPDIEGDDGAARAYYVRLLPLYTMETRRVQLCTLQCAISRLRTGAMRSRDCALVPRNLEIA